MSKTSKKKTEIKIKRRIRKQKVLGTSYQVLTGDGKTHIVKAATFQEALEKLKKFNY